MHNAILYAMKPRPPKNDKDDIMREMHPTRPPRMEGKVKEAMMQPVRKKRKKKEG